MNGASKAGIVAGVWLVLSACASSPQNLILGKWEVENSPAKMTVEFKGDGTAKLTLLGQTVQATYKFTAGNEMEWTVNGVTTKAKANVTATELELTYDENRTIKYARK